MSSYDPALPPISMPTAHLDDVRVRFLDHLRAADAGAGRPAPLADLEDAPDDWLLGLADGWAHLAEVFAFYQDRIVNEAFLATAERPDSLTRLFNSLGHRFPSQVAATTVLTYTLSDLAAGVDAVTRNRATLAGTSAAEQERKGRPGTADTSTRPSAQVGQRTLLRSGSQVRAIPGSPDQLPTTFSTLDDLEAVVGADRFPLSVPPPSLELATSATHANVAGTRTGLTVGRPVAIIGRDPATGHWLRWIRTVTAVTPDSGTGSTLVTWDQSLYEGPPPSTADGPTSGAAAGGAGSGPGGGPGGLPASVTDPALWSFARSSALFGGAAKPWSTRSPADRLATATLAGGPVPATGGVLSSADAGRTWTPRSSGLPAGATVTGALALGPLLLVAAGRSGLYRSLDEGPLTVVSLGTSAPVLCVGGSRRRLFAGTSNGVYESWDDGSTWQKLVGAAPTVLALRRSVWARLAGLSREAIPASLQAAVKTAEGDERELLSGLERDLARVGRRPTESPTPPQAGFGSTGPLTEQPRQVLIDHRLPATAVRRIAELPPALAPPGTLLVATDRGVFHFDGTNWWPDGFSGVVFDLEVSAQRILAATATGIFQRVTRQRRAAWEPYGNGLPGRAYAVIQADVTLAGTDQGVWQLQDPAGRWAPANGDPAHSLPAGTAVLALCAVGKSILAATAGGIYRSTDGAVTWQPSDDLSLFSVPSVDVADPEGPLPAALRDAFGAVGITLSPGAQLTSDQGNRLIRDGASQFVLTVTGTTATVLARGTSRGTAVLAAASPTAVAPGGPPGKAGSEELSGAVVVAGGAPLEAVADDWPGIGITGSAVELAAVVADVVPGSVVLLVPGQEPTAAVLATVSEAGPVTMSRFGTTASVTRMGLDTDLDGAGIARRTTAVWYGAASNPLQPGTSVTATYPAADTLVVAGPLPTGVAGPRLGVVSGKPVQLAAAPLGGAVRLTPSGAEFLGPAELDGSAVAVDDRGRVYVGGAEGVFRVAPASGGLPNWLRQGWIGGAASALAVLPTATLMAGGGAGVAILDPASDTWSPAGLTGVDVDALAVGDDVVVALAAGSVFSIPITSLVPPPGPPPGAAAPAAPPNVGWTAMAAPPGSAVALTASRAVVAIATEQGVYRADESKGWLAVGAAPPPGVTSLGVDGSGVLWAGSAAGVWSCTGDGARWRLEGTADLQGPVDAMAVASAGSAGDPGTVLALVAGRIFQRDTSGRWTEALPAPAVVAASVVRAADGTVWMAARTRVRLLPAAGGSVELGHDSVLTDLPTTGADLAGLDQGRLPVALAAALSARGAPVDASVGLVTQRPGEAWSLVGGSAVYTVAARSAPGRLSLGAWRNRAVADVLTAPVSTDGVTTVVLAAETGPSTLRLPDAAQLLLPARPEASPLIETVWVSSGQGSGGAGTSTLQLGSTLLHAYDPATVTVQLNAVRAVQGKRVDEPLGSGDPASANQSFPIKGPIASLPDQDRGSMTSTSTLSITVDGQLWAAVDDLGATGATDRVYLLLMGADGSGRVSFGDGVHGARLPAGNSNVVAHYLQGADPGAPPVAAGDLAQPLDRPQMVKGVGNPLAPLVAPSVAPVDSARAVSRSLNRVLSLSDYADLAAAQPGVAMARADWLSGGMGGDVVVSVWPSTDAPSTLVSDLLPVMTAAGWPGTRCQVLAATGVAVTGWVEAVGEATAGSIAAAIGGTRPWRPGAPLTAAQVITAALAVPGVQAARVLRWGRAGQPAGPAPTLAARPARRDPGTGRIVPAEVLYLDGATVTVETASARREPLR